MTNTDHERERRAFWDACCAQPEHDWDPSCGASKAACCAAIADAKLAERDKRFPAPIGGEP